MNIEVSEELGALLEKVKSRIAEEARRCCARGEYGEPVEVESMQELADYVRGCNAVILTFYSPTCPYCRAFAPIYAMAAEEYKWLPFLRVNTWILPEAARAMGVMGVPMTFGIARGRPVAVLYGYAGPEQLDELIRKTVEEAGCDPGRRGES